LAVEPGAKCGCHLSGWGVGGGVGALSSSSLRVRARWYPTNGFELAPRGGWRAPPGAPRLDSAFPHSRGTCVQGDGTHVPCREHVLILLFGGVAAPRLDSALIPRLRHAQARSRYDQARSRQARSRYTQARSG
jgi:hypothetical protein